MKAGDAPIDVPNRLLSFGLYSTDEFGVLLVEGWGIFISVFDCDELVQLSTYCFGSERCVFGISSVTPYSILKTVIHNSNELDRIRTVLR